MMTMLLVVCAAGAFLWLVAIYAMCRVAGVADDRMEAMRK